MSQHPTSQVKTSADASMTSVTTTDKSLLETTFEVKKRETVPDIHCDTASTVCLKPSERNDLFAALEYQCEGVRVGDYEVVSLIGRGGMAKVYRAKQLSLEREVALKVMSREYVSDPDMLARFKREAKVLGKLHHTNIIGCHGLGEIDGLHYLAMEYVAGSNLKLILKNQGRLSVEDSLSITLDLAHALKYAHHQQVIHRDVKPDNVMISTEGVVKLADLGLAKPEADNLGLTGTGVGVGTPIYMPPEQMRCARMIDSRADIYALGVVLYIMLSKQRPFVSKNFADLLQEKESGRFQSLRRKYKDIPEKLELIIAKMIDRKPENRYQTCEEVIETIEKLNLASQFLSKNFVQKQQHDVRQANQPTKFFTSDNYPILKPRENLWYVRPIADDMGYGRVKELTFEQLQDQIEARAIDSRALASRSPDEGFRALSTYAEFEPVFRLLLAKVRAERRTQKLQHEYEKIAHEVDVYENRKWWTRIFLSFGGWVKLLILLAAVIGLCVLAYQFVPPVVMLLLRKLGLVQ